MDYMPPKLVRKTLTQSDITYNIDYYEPPTIISGIVDESYPEYDNGVTYNVGDYIKLDALKKVYRCSASTIIEKHPLDFPDIWIDYGNLNSYKMLATDEFISDRATGTDAILEIDFSRKDTFAFVAADFVSVRVELIDNTTSTTILDETYIGRDYGSLSYSDYYYTDYKTLSRIVVDGLEWLPNSTLRLTFDGEVSIGALVSGLKQNLGTTLMGTALDFEDKSTVSTSGITGARSVLRYGSVRVIEARVYFNVDDFNVVANKVEAIIGRNILWIPSSEDKFVELVSIGYIERFKIPIESPTTVTTNTTIVGVL